MRWKPNLLQIIAFLALLVLLAAVFSDIGSARPRDRAITADTLDALQTPTSIPLARDERDIIKRILKKRRLGSL